MAEQVGINGADVLSVKGFVIDYVTWRLGKSHYVWNNAPAVRNGAEEEHEAMRLMCASHEETRAKFMRWGFDEFLLHKVREQFGENSTMRDLPTLSYLDVVDFIAFTGLECLEKATLGQYDEIGEIVHKSIEYLEDGIPRSWSGGSEGQKLYWAEFLASTSYHRQEYAAILKKRAEDDERFNRNLNFFVTATGVSIVIGYVMYKLL